MKAGRVNRRSNDDRASLHRSPGCLALGRPRQAEPAVEQPRLRLAPDTRITPPLAVERPPAKVTINMLQI